MDKKLQQLENQSLPDLSRLDQHWLQMRRMLQPGIIPAPKNKSWLKKWKFWVAAACVAAVILAGAYKLIFNKKDKPAIADKEIVPKVIPQPRLTDTVVTTGMQDNDFSFSAKRGLTRQRLIPQVTVHVTPVYFNTTDTATAVTNQPASSKKETVTLAGFFKQLEKETQEFVIDPLKDTLIHGNSGTTLFIPAHTFAATTLVTVLLKEYYTYEDFITNRLTTSSDGKQLISGGMLHLSAYSSGKEAGLVPGKSIRWYVPDTSAAMQEMQLFTGQVIRQISDDFKISLVQRGDSLVPSEDGFVEQINWIPQQLRFGADNFRPMVKVLDLRNEPYATHASKKGLVGHFLMAQNSRLSSGELKQALKDKYGYARVVLKKQKDRKGRIRRWLRSNDSDIRKEGLGDSTWVYPEVARIYRLTPTDTSKPQRTTNKSALNGLANRGNQLQADTVATGNANLFIALADRFSVDVSTLGWINCDRFYNDNRSKIPYYVDLGDTAARYNTFLVFDKIKSIMPGTIKGNRVLFTNVPEGEKAKVVSVGIRDGRAVASVEDVELGRVPFTGMNFTETSPAAFREQAAMIDK